MTDSIADELRRKRIARLENNTPIALGSTAQVANPSKDLEGDVEMKLTSHQTLDDVSGPSKKLQGPASGPLKKSIDSNIPPESQEDWIDRAIQDLLRVSLNNTSFVILESLKEELIQENIDIRLTVDILDRVFWSRLTEHRCLPSAFDYLLECWSRAESIRRSHKVKESSQKLFLVQEVQRLTVSYTLLTATTPLNNNDSYNLGDRLLFKLEKDLNFPWEFLESMVAKAYEDDILSETLEIIYDYLKTVLGDSPTKGNYRPCLLLLENILSFPHVADATTTLSNFNPDEDNGSSMERNSLLGTFLKISPLDPSVTLQNFPNPTTISQFESKNIYSTLNSELKVIQNSLFSIINKILRSSSTSRQRLLRYLGRIIDLNHKRTAMNVDTEAVSSDGFMLNLTYILIRLCQPFTDIQGSKIDKIDIDYLRGSPLFSVLDETKISVDVRTSKEFFSAPVEPKESNFVTEIFYLSIAFLHYGIGGCLQSKNRLKQAIDDLQHHVTHLQEQLPRWQNTPQLSHLESTIERIKKRHITAVAYKLSLEAVLSNQVILGDFFDFYQFLFTWIIRVIDPNHMHPKVVINLPVKGDAPEIFQNFPEYFIEAGVTYSLFLSQNLPQVLISSKLNPLLWFSVVFLRNSSYIKNPYLKSKLVEILFFGSLEVPGKRQGYFYDLFTTDKLCLDHLFHSLMNFYIEIEQTGASSQFYDKFNTRYYISQIIRCIWNHPVYRRKLENESKDDVMFFVRFVALLLNDATYLLDESLTKLTEIHRLQREITEEPSSSAGDLEEKRQQLAAAERHATSYMQLTNQTVAILALFTSAVPKAFVSVEIVDRLAAMLNYNVNALVGKKCRDLKVQNPEKYGFNPRKLLSSICDTYLNLRNELNFATAVARDGRSFDPQMFDRARDILGKGGLKTNEELNALREFVINAEEIRKSDEQGEEELGEIPDEFLDPLMYTLMENPVILPSSHVTIDLATIKSHLLSDPKDPFNRVPLKLEDIVPNTELKAKIEEFKASKKKSHQ